MYLGFEDVCTKRLLFQLSGQTAKSRATQGLELSYETLSESLTYECRHGGDFETVQKYLKEASSAQRRELLRFMSGSPIIDIEEEYTIVFDQTMPKGSLPKASTCDYQLIIPSSPYEDFEDFKKKLEMAIAMCGEIDTDFVVEGHSDEDEDAEQED